mmetsp:Transcript_14270/g.19895  ORF Transcript_14270/g.19895 Transcript_14270/m.19895 type:complete len:241 (+) Transcript_14270:42-764(+)
MKWDTLIQGIGLILLSLGLSVGLYFFLFLRNDMMESSCTIQKISVSDAKMGSMDTYTKDTVANSNNQRVVLIEVLYAAIFQSQALDHNEKQKNIGYISIPIDSNDGCSSSQCISKYMPFQEGEQVKCFYNPLASDTATGPQTLTFEQPHNLHDFKGQRAFLYIFAFTFMGIPCCGVIGLVMFFSGLFELQLVNNFMRKLRCDWLPLLNEGSEEYMAATFSHIMQDEDLPQFDDKFIGKTL